MMQKWRIQTGSTDIEVDADGWLDALTAARGSLNLRSEALARLSCAVQRDGSVLARDLVNGTEIRVSSVQLGKPPAFSMPISSFATHQVAEFVTPVLAPQTHVEVPVVVSPQRAPPARAPALDPAPVIAAPVIAVPVIAAPPAFILPPPVAPSPVIATPTPTPPAVVAPAPPAVVAPASVIPPPVIAAPPRTPPAVVAPAPVISPPVMAAAPQPVPAPIVAPAYPPPPPILAPAPVLAPPPPLVMPAPVLPPREPEEAEPVPQTDMSAMMAESLMEMLFLELGELSMAQGVAEASGIALRIVLEHVPAEAGAVLIRTRAGDGLRFRAASGPASRALIDTVIPLGKGIAGQVDHLGIGILIEDVRADIRHNNRVDRSTGFQTRSMLAVPVRADVGANYGCLELINPPRPFTGADFELAARVAASLGVFLHSAYAAS